MPDFPRSHRQFSPLFGDFGLQVRLEPAEDALPVFRVSEGCLAAADEAFIAHCHTRPGCDGIEAVSDRCLARSKQRMFLEFPRHYDLARRINLSELAAASVGAAICKTNRYSPFAADAEVRFPSFLTVKVRMSPPTLDLICSEGAEDPLGRRRNFHRCDDRTSSAVRHSSRGSPFRSRW